MPLLCFLIKYFQLERQHTLFFITLYIFRISCCQTEVKKSPSFKKIIFLFSCPQPEPELLPPPPVDNETKATEPEKSTSEEEPTDEQDKGSDSDSKEQNSDEDESSSDSSEEQKHGYKKAFVK